MNLPSEKIKVLDKGYVQLVDIMGDDQAIVDAARVSIAGENVKPVQQNKGLIRYLMRHRHTTPIEQVETKWRMKLPIFVARQIIRHRTFCLAGDVTLSFDLPGGKTNTGNPRHYPLTVKDVFDRFQPTRNRISSQQKNPYHRRDLVKNMKLRCVNEETGEIEHTRICDIWSNGEKQIYEVSFDNGSVLRATLDHRCYTSKGWLSLGDALEQRVEFVTSQKKRKPKYTAPALTSEELLREQWKSVEGYEGYEVSTLGRVRTWRNTRGVYQKKPKIKKGTINSKGYFVVSLSSGGLSRAFLVHRLVLKVFKRLPESGEQARHVDGCCVNNRITNLEWRTVQENHNDRMSQDGDQRLVCGLTSVVGVKCAGVEETFDLSVEGPWHNFFAGGVVVHNSFNEMSARYSEIPEEYYVPELTTFKVQASKNKQGRGETTVPYAEKLVSIMRGEAEDAFTNYHMYLEKGTARELARVNLPLSTYTEWVMKGNLHNLFHFLSLRLHPHAQYEIRVYAEEMGKLIKPFVPLAYEAFEDYRLNGTFLTSPEIKALQLIVSGQFTYNATEVVDLFPTKREHTEFVEKFNNKLQFDQWMV